MWHKVAEDSGRRGLNQPPDIADTVFACPSPVLVRLVFSSRHFNTAFPRSMSSDDTALAPSLLGSRADSLSMADKPSVKLKVTL